MCADDAMAPVALGMALSWVSNAGQTPAMTAALAFAGGLAIRYPEEALDWLWFLSLRGIRVSNVAQRALALLFQGAAERGEGVLPVLRLLAGHVDRDLRDGLEPPRARAALAAVLAVLDSTRLRTGDESLTAWLLSSQPLSVRPLGVLWAWTLRNAHHRADAVRALCRTLRALEGREGAVAAASALGEVVWSALPPDQAVLVRRAIRQACVASPARQYPQPTRELVMALLNAGARQTRL